MSELVGTYELGAERATGDQRPRAGSQRVLSGSRVMRAVTSMVKKYGSRPRCSSIPFSQVHVGLATMPEPRFKPSPLARTIVMAPADCFAKAVVGRA